MRVSGQLTGEQFWAVVAEGEQRIRAVVAARPCYGLAGWSGAVLTTDWSWENDDWVSGAFGYAPADADDPVLQVTTTVRDPRPDSTVHTRLVIDGSPVAAALWTAGDHWYVGTDGVLVEGTGTPPDDLAVQRVTDPEPYFAGRRARIRAARGGA